MKSHERLVALLTRWPMNLSLMLACCFASTSLTAQTTSISGVVNSYYAVTAILPARDAVRVSNPAGLSQFDKVMLIQMKGASVTTSNSINFGDTTSLNNAGNYEIATICSIQTDTIYFFFNLLNQYTISGKVQLVRFASYASALVTDTVKAAPWNNTTGTGGVIAISVTDDLTLNAPVFADSSGYRGGTFKLSNGTCGNGFPIAAATGYYYDASSLGPQDGAYKGEGVYSVPIAQSGGRGAAANGGGGGNNHNNGGAGGANLSMGGVGGGNSSGAGCVTNLHGEAGKALSSWGGYKLFFGGGGGAGHANDGFVSSWGGGNGGGIVFIEANNLISNSQKISANGQGGGPALSDGASGGGAGGSIIMDVLTSYSGTLTVEANGGAGGTEDDGGNIKRCYGAGGGGSGGAIYFTSAIPAATVSAGGGAAGSELARNVGCNAAVPASAGLAGAITPAYTYSRSFDPAGSCHSVLPLYLASFNATAKQQTVLLYWQLSDPGLANRIIIERQDRNGHWTALVQLPVTDKAVDNWIDPSPYPGINYYRLKLDEKDQQTFYSPVKAVEIKSNAQRFTIYPNPSAGTFNITGNFSGNESFLVSDVSGRILCSGKLTPANNRVTINVPLASGIYLVRVNDTVNKLVIR